MKVLAFFLFIALALLVGLLIRGVQRAKKKGVYLAPDNLKEYGVVDIDEETLPGSVFAPANNEVKEEVDDNFTEQKL